MYLCEFITYYVCIFYNAGTGSSQDVPKGFGEIKLHCLPIHLSDLVT